MGENIVLTYFNTPGLAESIRYILSYAGAKFEDKRIVKADWPELKNSTPRKKLPILEVDGKVFHQSVSICRFLGQKYNLESDDPCKRAQLEAIVDDMRDLQSKMVEWFRSKSDESKKEMDDAVAELFTVLDPLAVEGYFYGSTPSWVDVYFAGMSKTMATYMGVSLEPYPNLASLVEKIRSNDGVSNYIKNAPEPEKMG